jgi:aminobenzoyl-glutamate transport protein
MTVAVILVSILITIITERISIRNVEKYEYKDEKKELRLGKREYRGLLFAISAGVLYLLIFIYNIIPGLPFSGNLLDYTQNFYIDKLFSHDSFFSNGFVFIVTMFFIILGLFYGLGAKTIKNNNDFCEDLTHSLDGIGRTLILILLKHSFKSKIKL